MSKSKAGSPMIRKLLRELEPGWHLEHTRNSSKHLLVRPDGQVARLDDGRPVILPNSPTQNDEGTYRRRLEAAGAVRRRASRRKK